MLLGLLPYLSLSLSIEYPSTVVIPDDKAVFVLEEEAPPVLLGCLSKKKLWFRSAAESE